MKRTNRLGGLGLAIAWLLAACQTTTAPHGDDDDGYRPEPTQAGDAANDGPAENGLSQEAAALNDDVEVLEEIQLVEGVTRQVTRDSTPPAAEFITPTGSVLTIWVEEDGTSALIEGVPLGAESALQNAEADSPLELFQELAPEGAVAPRALAHGRRFSVLEAEAAERLAGTSPEALHPSDLQPTEIPEGVGAEKVPYATTYCSKSMTNHFYDFHRPGMFDNSESVAKTTRSQTPVREGRREKDYQAFFQTSYNQWTPRLTAGGLQSSYARVSAQMCTGTGRVRAFRCSNHQSTANYGCGASGSSIATTYGPHILGAGALVVIKYFAGFDLVRARLDQMSVNDLAMWSVMSSKTSYGAIDDCHY